MKPTYIVAAIVVIVLVVLFWRKKYAKAPATTTKPGQLPAERVVLPVPQGTSMANMLVNNDVNDRAAVVAGLELTALRQNVQPTNAFVSTGVSEPSRHVAVRTSTGYNIVQNLN